jgi:hypothetical protein
MEIAEEIAFNMFKRVVRTYNFKNSVSILLTGERTGNFYLSQSYCSYSNKHQTAYRPISLEVSSFFSFS